MLALFFDPSFGETRYFTRAYPPCRSEHSASPPPQATYPCTRHLFYRRVGPTRRAL